MLPETEITIVGAGPYGLSIAAHLIGVCSDYRVVGTPMDTWLMQMPEGMMLKSAGLSSTLYDPGSNFTLEQYCHENAIPYQPMGLPVSLTTFSNYGLAFQQRFVPDVIDDQVEFIDSHGDGFLIELRNGGSYRSRKVILAVGLSYFRNIPDVLESLPESLYSHSSANRNVNRFHGRDIAVLGGGSSAIDLAVLLYEAGANIQLIARRKFLDFNEEERWPRPLFERIRRPMTGVGPGWGNVVTADLMPRFYPYLPDSWKVHVLQRTLGPAAGWFMKERIADVPMRLGRSLESAQDVGGRVRLEMRHDSATESLDVDHVIAATGYKADVQRLSFLSDNLRSRISVIAAAPSLSAGFESSVPGLFFTGPVSAPSAGPIMRFSLGAGLTARRIVRALRPMAQAA